MITNNREYPNTIWVYESPKKVDTYRTVIPLKNSVEYTIVKTIKKHKFHKQLIVNK